MRIHSIYIRSYVDGPGQRTVLFVQGCSLHCPGCQNKQLWTPAGGTDLPVEFVAGQLLATGLPITVSGGEPFDQADELARLLALLAHEGRHVIIYSGYSLEELCAKARTQRAIEMALQLADVLVDGRYVPRLDNPYLQYRGSANQRVIDLAALARGELTMLDWDTPELVLTSTGEILGVAPLVAEFSTVGRVGSTRRCGLAGG